MISEVIDKILQIDQRDEVDRIRFKGAKIWTPLKIYLYFSSIKDSASTSPTLPLKSAVKSLLWMRWNPFKTYPIWVISSSDQRKLIDGKWKDRMDFVSRIQSEALYLELPNKFHAAPNAVSSSNFLSRIWLVLFERFAEKFISIQSDVDGADVLRGIVRELEAPLNVDLFLRRFKAKYLSMRWAMRILGRPHTVFITSFYSNVPYVLALKRSGVRVIEMQHGVITDKHVGYAGSRPPDQDVVPDQLLTYGEVEINELKGSGFAQLVDLKPTGHFYTDYVYAQGPTSEPETEPIIVVTAQDIFGQEFIDFLNEVVRIAPTLNVLLRPRFRPYEWYLENGLDPKVKPSLEDDTYVAISKADWHSTVCSSCAYESIALGHPNVLIELDGMAKKYLHDMVYPQTHTWIAETPESFVEIVRSKGGVSPDEIRNRATFTPDFIANINRFVEETI